MLYTIIQVITGHFLHFEHNEKNKQGYYWMFNVIYEGRLCGKPQ